MKRIGILILLMTFAVVLTVGCGSNGEQGLSDANLKTAEEHKADAAAEITADNAEAELDKLMKEIDQDIAAEPS